MINKIRKTHGYLIKTSTIRMKPEKKKLFREIDDLDGNWCDLTITDERFFYADTRFFVQKL